MVSDEDEVTCADWCKSGFKLATVSDETPLYIWGRQDGFNPKSKQINATVEARILVDTYSNDSDNYEPTKNKRRVNFLPRSCAFGNSYHAIKAESSFEETQNLTLTPKRGKKFAENKNRSSPKTPLTPSIKNYFNRI